MRNTIEEWLSAIALTVLGIAFYLVIGDIFMTLFDLYGPGVGENEF